MAIDTEPVTLLSTDESWQLLSAMALGRLVTVAAGRPEIFPVNFVVQRHTVLFRTAEGAKLFSAAAGDQVLFEVDDHNVVDAWSVVVRGIARVLTAADEVYEAERAGLYPWIATEKLRFVRITPTEISGRRFVFGPEPESGLLLG
jgi:nitroimidazol reductase NimA-like FMN-containing flavoprotein (pyridoxamine 5'-phosphate oxidase superfamily)